MLINIDNHELLDGDKMLARDVLAEYLIKGEITLFLGSGISYKLGLPQWWELVRNSFEEKRLNIPNELNKDTPIDSLLRSMNTVRRNSVNDTEYLSIVKKALYKNVNPAELKPSELLIALNAILMPSKRGSVNTVVTLNFDSMLEWMLHLHGFTTQVITSVPALERAEDVTIYHPHGYLPLGDDLGNPSEKIVLDRRSYDAFDIDPWSEKVTEIIRTKIILAVGLSFDDINIRRSSEHAIEATKKQNRVSGFWLCGPDFDDQDDLVEKNIVPLNFEDFDEYPSFILSIAQKASKLKM